MERRKSDDILIFVVNTSLQLSDVIITFVKEKLQKNILLRRKQAVRLRPQLRLTLN